MDVVIAVLVFCHHQPGIFDPSSYFNDTRCSVSLPESQMGNLILSSHCRRTHDLGSTEPC